jgi:ParB family chromosome partitioning protein
MTVLEHLNPAQLTIDANVRADVRLDAGFLASIKQHGVLQPVVAHRTEAGVHVLYGQRRTLAAV